MPMLAGSAAFAVAEGLSWRVGLSRAAGEARAIYGCILAIAAAGVAMNLLDLERMRALIWSAVVNGHPAAPVLMAVMLIAERRDVMGQLALSRPLSVLGWLTSAARVATALGLALTLTLTLWT